MNERIEYLGEAAVEDLRKTVPTPRTFHKLIRRRKARRQVARASLVVSAVAIVAVAGLAMVNQQPGRIETANNPDDVQPAVTNDSTIPPETTGPSAVVGQPTACGIPFKDPSRNTDPKQKVDFWHSLDGFMAFPQGVFAQSSEHHLEDDVVYVRSKPTPDEGQPPSNLEVSMRWPADTAKQPEPGSELETQIDDHGLTVWVKDRSVHDVVILAVNTARLNEIFGKEGGCTTLSVAFTKDGKSYGPLVIDYGEAEELEPEPKPKSIVVDEDPTVEVLCDEPSIPNVVTSVVGPPAGDPEEAFLLLVRGDFPELDESRFGREKYQRIELSSDDSVVFFYWDVYIYKVEADDDLWRVSERHAPGC